MTAQKRPYVVWFKDVGKEDVALVGGKGANLGEMTQANIPVPQGFIITASAYYHFIKENDLEKKIRHHLHNLNTDDPNLLNHASKEVKRLIIAAILPKDLALEILKAYHQMAHPDNGHTLLKNIDTLLGEPLVAVRSSATAEDLPSASFAGQQATFLNIQGDVSLLENIKECYASLFEARAIFYRRENHFDDFKVGIAVPVQKMVQSEMSGVMFTIDPVTNDKTKITIEAIFGLGELIVQGSVTPDHYELDKNTGHLLKKQIEKQTVMLTKVGKKTKETGVARNMQEKQKISDAIIHEIAALGKKIEHHYFFPQDIEWAVEDRKVYIVQTRPITTINQNAKGKRQNESAVSSHKLEVILKGDPASPGMGSGPVKVITSAQQIGKIKLGDVLVAPKTNPDYVPAMRKAAAIVTDHGGRTSHAAIVSRELGIPCVVGTDIGTKKLKTGLVITVNGSTGEVYKGALEKGNGKTVMLTDETSSQGVLLKTATNIYVNLAEPERAAEISKLHVDGVGLLRAEFMIAEIGIHPRKLMEEGKEHVFIDALAEKLKTFCENFSPRPVVYRLSDFKTNEYRNLKGGAAFEPEEENPMIGFRGAYRFIVNPAVLKLEIDAIRKVREKLGFKNLWLMIPYIRTVQELIQVKKHIADFGLERGPTFKLWMMVEIPSNVILIDEFIEAGIDGISIGSNDLTMLTLGTDRDNSDLAKVFSEKDEAVMRSLEKVVKAAHKHKITSSICGQAPSVYPDLVEKLVSFGITSMSVNPDAVGSVRKTVYEAEKKIWQKS